MSSNSDLRTVLSAYPGDCRPMRFASLGSAGGFSGAQFWRMTSSRGELVLRRWPRSHPDVQRLNFIHDVLRRVIRNGFLLVPEPIRTTEGATFVCESGHLWELTRWMPGKADYHERSSDRKLIAAMTALANFHSAARLHLQEDRSPGISERSEILQRLMDGEAEHIDKAMAAGDRGWPELSRRGTTLIRLFHRIAAETARVLDRCRSRIVPLQPCLRDVWHDHILYQGDDVSGLVDFGSMRLDNVATDIARLLGSLTQGDRQQWLTGLEAYQQIRSLSPPELQLLDAFDHSTIALSGINWLRWIFLDGRQFDRREEIQARMDQIIRRLETLELGFGPTSRVMEP